MSETPRGPDASDALRWLWLWVFGSALVLVCLFSGMREVWLDETHSWHIGSLPLLDAMRFVMGDVHPPLHFLATWLATSLFGDSALALRLPSIAAFLLGGIAFYHLSLRISEDRAASTLGMALFFASPALFVTGAEARMYSLLVLFFILLLHTFWPLLLNSGDTEQKGRIVAVGVIASLMYYTHYVSVFLIAGLFAFWVVQSVRSGLSIRPILSCSLVVLLLTAPWYPVMLAQQSERNALGTAVEVSWSDPSSIAFEGNPPGAEDQLGTLIRSAASAVGVFPADNAGLLALLAVPFGIVGVGGVVLLLRRDRATWLVTTLVASNVVAAVALGVGARRFVIVLAPLFLILLLRLWHHVARWMEAPRRAFALVLTVGLVYTAGVWRVLAASYPQPTSDLVALLKEEMNTADTVVFSVTYGQVPFEYHAGRQGLDVERIGFPVTMHEWWESQPFKGWGGPVVSHEELRRFAERLNLRQRESDLWLVLFETNYYDPGDLLVEELLRRGAVMERFDRGDINVLYRLYRIRPSPTRPLLPGSI